MDEIYIIVMENGICFMSKIITNEMLEELHDGISTIIRCSDASELSSNNTWTKLPTW